MQKETYELIVEPITGVHIGTGEKILPLDYIVTESRQGNHLYIKYSTDKILGRVACDTMKRQQFERASLSGNMKELREFFNANADVKNHPEELAAVCGVTGEFSKRYNEKKDGDPLDNALEVCEMYRPSGKKTPVIPGSSLKGAIRTAVLNDFISRLDDRDYQRFADEIKDKKQKTGKPGNADLPIQQKLLGNYRDAKQDPFRAVEISDCTFPAKGTQLVGLLKNISVNKRNGELESVDMQMIAEILKGTLLNPDIKGTGKIRFALNLSDCPNGVRKKITAGDIVSACNYFYKREFDAEYKNFYEAASYSDECKYIERLKDIVHETASQSASFLLRVGRWSQVEFVTYEETYRDPKTPVKRGKEMPYGTTRTVFSCDDGLYLPLGWCKCTLRKTHG